MIFLPNSRVLDSMQPQRNSIHILKYVAILSLCRVVLSLVNSPSQVELSSSPIPNDYIFSYANHWDSLLTLEHRTKVEELRERRKMWSLSKLEASGMCIFNACAEPDSEVLGEKIIRIFKKGETRIREKYNRGDVLLMTPDRVMDGYDPVPREILIVDVGKDWMTAGVGPSWPFGLWESRKHPGAFTVRLDKTAAQAPLKAQRRALERLRKDNAGEAVRLLAMTFTVSNRMECFDEVKESFSRIPSYLEKFYSSNSEMNIENAVWDAVNKAENATNKFNPNQSQLDAIAWALQRSISLIRGPPGTGKTRVAALLVSAAIKLQIPLENIDDIVIKDKNHVESEIPKLNFMKPINRVLAVTHSNGAADVLLEALLQMGVPAIRLGRPASVADSIQHRTVVAIAERTPQIIELRKRMTDVTMSKQERTGASYDLKKYTREVEESILKTAPVVVTSCIGAHQFFDILPADSIEPEFPLVILDEAAQTTEPALLCALAAAKAHQVILVGDTCQLPPTITAMNLRDSLGVSPMERLEKIGAGEVTLKYQYRMPPSLLKHPSQYFYNGLVISGEDISDDQPLPKGFSWPSSNPFAYINIGDDDEVSHNFGGKTNPREADLVVSIVLDLLSSGDVKTDNIAVISPYSKQVQLIRTRLAYKQNRGENIRVGTVDSYQGQETGIVIFSAVRSNHMKELGFLRDSRRLCVAITRAKKGLIVIGDKTVLRSCRHWAALLDFFDKEGCVVNAEDTKSADEKLIEAARLQKRNRQTNYDGKTDLFLNDLFDENDDLFGQCKA